MASSSLHQDLKNILLGILKLVLSMVLATGAYYAVLCQTADYRTALDARSAQAPSSPPRSDIAAAKKGTETKAPHQIPGTVENFERAVPGMKETSDLLVNWAIVLFGGTIGIAVLAKGAKIRDGNWGLVLVPPTWTLLYSSLLHGSRFKGILTHQLVSGQYVFRELNLELFLQMKFFEYSLATLAFLALWYLFFRFSRLEQQEKPAATGE